MTKLNIRVLVGVLFISFVSVGFQGCKKFRKGVLEKMEYWAASGNAYFLAKFIDPDLYSGEVETMYEDPSNSPNRYANYYYYYHEDESPASLGYKEGPHIDSDGEDMWYSKEGHDTPGENGYWKDGPSTTGGGGGGGGNCSGGYQSPTTDAQLDAYCGAAYAYRCMDGKPLSDPQVQAVCQYYNDMKEPGVPDCPYCK